MTPKDLRELMSYLIKTHPYPDDVFIPPTKGQWKEFHKVLENAGFKSGGFVGHCCRIGYDACLHQIEKTKNDRCSPNL